MQNCGSLSNQLIYQSPTPGVMRTT